MSSTATLATIVGVALCAVSIGSVTAASRGQGDVHSVFRHPVIFLLAWLLLSPVMVVWSGFDAALVGVGVAGGIIGSCAHPVFAVSFLVNTLVLRPWEIFPEVGPLHILPRGIAALCVFSWLLEMVRQRSILFVLDRFSFAFLGLVAWLYVCSFASFNGADSTQFVTASMVPVVVVILVARNVLIPRWAISYTTGTLAISCSAVAVCALWVTASSGSLFGTTLRLHSFGQWGNANDLAALFVATIPIAFARALPCGRSRLFSRMCWYSLTLLMGGCLLLTQSRGGVAALFAAVLLALFVKNRNPKVIFATIATCVLVGIGALLAFNREAGDMEVSKDSRLNYAVVGLKMLKSSPVFGVGPGNYPLLYESFSTVFDEFGQRTAHSSWILILSEAGIPGFLLFLYLVSCAARSAWQARVQFLEVLQGYCAYFIAVSILSQSYALLTYFLMVLPVAMVHGMRVLHSQTTPPRGNEESKGAAGFEGRLRTFRSTK